MGASSLFKLISLFLALGPSYELRREAKGMIGLLLVALTIFIVCVTSDDIDDFEGVKRYPAHRVLLRRQVDDAPARKHAGGHKPPSASKPGHQGSTDKPSTKKHKKAEKAKKMLDDMADDYKTTTAKPKNDDPEKPTSSTMEPHKPSKGSTKKPPKRGDKEKTNKPKDNAKDGNDEDKKKGDKTTAKPSTKPTTKKPVGGKKHKMKTEEKLKVANERWLQNQEVVAIEHMLAGVYDWMKVLKQTKGKTFNKKTAGELFDKVNNELAGMLGEQDKPSKLISYYRQTKIK